MTLKLYNTAVRGKQEFHPLEDNHVRMYVCGVTVYDLCHIGHARSAIVFDVLFRYLHAKGYDVTYVRNFTDVDDKIINRAGDLGKDPAELAQEYIDAFNEDMGRLHVLNADVEPRATEHIQDMIDMVKVLVERGHAYVEDGDVFFSVESLKDYGVLSGRKLEDMQAGSRIAVDEKKRHPMDFALWKGAKPREPQWPSPWGPGRPGWHIECSVMSNHYLGPSFDIHGGGRDLLFPHHENERAQSVAATGGHFANFWVHNGFVTVESEKMSKSLGNFLTIRDALDTYHPEVLRLFLLSKHYRSPLDFSRSEVEAMQSGLVRIYRTLERLEEILGPRKGEEGEIPHGLLTEDQVSQRGSSFLDRFVQAMDDDLNTAGAIGVVFDKVRDLNKSLDAAGDSLKKDTAEQFETDREELYLVGGVLGLLYESPAEFFKQLSSESERIDADEIEALIEQRSAARASKDWARADEIRDRLKGMGVVLEDGPQGTSWRYDV